MNAIDFHLRLSGAQTHFFSMCCYWRASSERLATFTDFPVDSIVYFFLFISMRWLFSRLVEPHHMRHWSCCYSIFSRLRHGTGFFTWSNDYFFHWNRKKRIRIFLLQRPQLFIGFNCQCYGNGKTTAKPNRTNGRGRIEVPARSLLLKMKALDSRWGMKWPGPQCRPGARA